MYRDMYRIVKQVSRYVSYREVSIVAALVLLPFIESMLVLTDAN